MCVMLGDRLSAPNRVHHLHIAGRGSTARKLILGGVARVLGCIHVLHLHDFDYAADFERRSAWQKRAVRTLFSGADRVVVLGDRDFTTAYELLGVPKDRIKVLHNAVPDPHRAEAANPGASVVEPVKIVFLGQLGPRKGVPELLVALADPVMAALNWQAVIAGDGPVEQFRAKVKDLGIAGRVTLPGWLNGDEARGLCESSDILVLPSHGEGMAMAVLEGLAHGLAVVTTRVGAHEEVLTDGVTCAFVPVGDADALAQTLAGLVADPKRCAELGRAGREHFLSSLCMDVYVDRLDALHRSVAYKPVAEPGSA